MSTSLLRIAIPNTWSNLLSPESSKTLKDHSNLTKVNVWFICIFMTRHLSKRFEKQIRHQFAFVTLMSNHVFCSVLTTHQLLPATKKDVMYFLLLSIAILFINISRKGKLSHEYERTASTNASRQVRVRVYLKQKRGTLIVVKVFRVSSDKECFGKMDSSVPFLVHIFHNFVSNVAIF